MKLDVLAPSKKELVAGLALNERETTFCTTLENALPYQKLKMLYLLKLLAKGIAFYIISICKMLYH